MVRKIHNKPSFIEEKTLWNNAVTHVIGIDEVGRGAFAGPVVAAGVIFDPKHLKYFENKTHKHFSFLQKINDSKKLTPKVREQLSEKIKKHCSYYAISRVEVSVINKIGIGKATTVAMRKVVSSVLHKVSSIKSEKNRDMPDTNSFVLVDGFRIKHVRHVGLKKQKAIVKGDQKCISIAAASIIAKVYRDNLMRQLAQKYPQYGFAAHKGYGTKQHQKAIFTYGLSRIHRKSFDLQQFLGT